MFQFDRDVHVPEFIDNSTLKLMAISVLVVLAAGLFTYYFDSNRTEEDIGKNNEQFIPPEDAKNISKISSDVERLKLSLGQLQENLTLIGIDRESMSKRIENLQSFLKKTDVNIMSNNKAIDEIKENVKEFNDALYKMKNEMAIKLENSDKRIISLEADLRKCNSRLQTIMDKNAESYSKLENKLNTLSQNLADIERKYKELQEKMSETEMEIKEQGRTGVRLEKSSKENNNYMKQIEITSYWVDILMLCIILILLITTMRKESNNRNTGVGFAPDKCKVIELEKKPAVVSFNPFSSEAHRRLANLFLDNYHYIIVHSSQDTSKIHSKVVYLFVEFNDRNIILEAETETQQIKRETVDSIRRIGGTPVVIYRLHSESRNLENGKLYSDKLTSIQSHPTLRDLSSKNCVLSIDREFTEYQRIHLLNFLEN